MYIYSHNHWTFQNFHDHIPSGVGQKHLSYYVPHLRMNYIGVRGKQRFLHCPIWKKIKNVWKLASLYQFWTENLKLILPKIDKNLVAICLEFPQSVFKYVPNVTKCCVLQIFSQSWKTSKEKVSISAASLMRVTSMNIKKKNILSS